MRFLRWFGLVCGVLLLALVVLRFLSFDQLREPLSGALSAMIGRPLRIDGDIHIEVDLQPHIAVEQVSISELPGHADLGRVELEFQLLPLLRGVFDISEVVLSDGTVEIDRSVAPGEEEAEPARREPLAAEKVIALTPNRVRLRDLTIVHINRAGLVTTYEFDRVDFEAPDSNSPIVASMAGRIDGREIDAVADLGTLATLDAGDEPFPVSISGTFDRMQLAVEGTMADGVGLSGLDLKLSLEAPHLRSIRAFADRNLPEIGPVRARANLTDRDGQLGFEGVRIQIGDADDPIVVTAEGEVDDIDDLDEIAFRLELEADDLPLIGELIGIDLPAVGHVSLSGSFHGSNELLSSEGFSLGLDDSVIAGTISSGFAAGRRPTLTAHFESEQLDLEDIGIKRRDPNEKPPGAGRWSSEELIDVGRLPAIDARISVRIGEIAGRADLLIDELSAVLVLTEELVAIEQFRIEYAGGNVQGETSIQTQQDPLVVAVKLEGKEVRLERILAQVEIEPSFSGLLDAHVDLKAHGSSMRALRSDVTGRARFLVREGWARSSYANALQGDLLNAAFGKRGPKQFDEVQCLIGDLRAKRGVTEITTLWLETDITTIRASGHVDLRSDTVDVKVKPTPKRRGLFSYAADVTIKGPLAKPNVAPVPAALVRSAVEGLVRGVLRPTGVIFEPVTDPVLAALFMRRGGESGPCAGYVPAVSGAEGATK